MRIATGALCWLFVAVSANAVEGSEVPEGIQVEQYAPKTGSFPGCTHIAFNGEIEIVTTGQKLFYRPKADAPFQESAINVLDDAHSLVFHSNDRLYYATDTGHHRLIAFEDLARPRLHSSWESLADTPLKRPHDVVSDPQNGLLYSLNPDSSQVFRIQPSDGKADVLDLSQHLGYSRALSIVEGRLYVIGSSVGAVVEVIDFGTQDYKIHKSFEKRANAVAGSWKSTGLVLNDVDFFEGYWYATSYFCPTYAGGHDCDEHKLIRFRDWQEFQTGDWQDLSQLLPSQVVPYYLTPRQNGLYLALFNHESPGRGDAVLRLTLAR